MSLMQEALGLGNSKESRYCRFKKYKIRYIDYKNAAFLMRFLNPQGKIKPRRLSGNSAKYQKKVAKAIERARILALFPKRVDNLN